MTTPIAAPTTVVKSGVVTGLDATPNARPSAGQGGSGRLVTQWGTALVGATDASTVGYRLVRIPSNAIIKSVKMGFDLNGASVTTLTLIAGLLFSDANDGTTPANQVNSAQFSSACFLADAGAGVDVSTSMKSQFADITFGAAGANTLSTFTDGFYVPSASGMPIWLAITQGGPGPQTDGAWAGFGRTTLTTSPSYELTQDPGGFFDIYAMPSTTNSITKAIYLTCECTYVGG